MILLILALVSHLSAKSTPETTTGRTFDQAVLKQLQPLYDFDHKIKDLLKETDKDDLNVEQFNKRLNLLKEELNQMYNTSGNKDYFKQLREFSNTLAILNSLVNDHYMKYKLHENDEKFQPEFTDILQAIKDKNFEYAENKLNEINNNEKLINLTISAYKFLNYKTGNLLEFIDYVKNPKIRFSLYETLYNYIMKHNSVKVSKPNNIFRYDISTQCELMKFEVFLKNDTKENIYPMDMAENVGHMQNEIKELFSQFQNRRDDENLIAYFNDNADERSQIRYYILFYNDLQRCTICYGFVTCFLIPL
ncbi:hypothetical protein O3M35_003056 [Rhynocoris fuscipes]|uniref:Uncharacterized protein n=1 Tax=Rhynocoris fuscipes TaxID=488301 RepID=A0AAW1CIR4_9HEMI